MQLPGADMLLLEVPRHVTVAHMPSSKWRELWQNPSIWSSGSAEKRIVISDKNSGAPKSSTVTWQNLASTDARRDPEVQHCSVARAEAALPGCTTPRAVSQDGLRDGLCSTGTRSSLRALHCSLHAGQVWPILGLDEIAASSPEVKSRHSCQVNVELSFSSETPLFCLVFL